MTTVFLREQYFVYENRLASFQGPHPVKRRASNASSRAPKTLTWPHKFLPPFELAKAGFFFEPTPSNPDNVVCYLCNKNMDGWEPDDNPIEEHLKHSPDCGWAVTAAIEAEHNGFERVDPREATMLEARKATFAGRWPYESKKGWKCKTKQLAEAGWKYTPTNESDDNTTCAYCQLALDGWESSDKPLDEHYKRSPNCPFFEMINTNPPPPKKTARSKAARGSKASRMSMQSVTTAASDLTTITDAPVDPEDSVMTTTSVLTQGSRKTTRSKRAPAATAKGRKTRAKKDEAVEIHEDADVDPIEVDMPPPPPPKPTRGRKRTSEAVEDSVLTNAEAPAPKKRAVRGGGRGSQTVDSSVLTTASQDVDMVEVPAKATAGRKKATAAKTRTRKASAVSVASTASAASLRARVPDDDELDRQLQADLERPLTDDEDLAADSESERRKPPVASKAKGKKTTKKASAPQPAHEAKEDYAMFDPAPPQVDEAAVDADLHALEAEMAETQEEVQEIAVPKKGRKAGGVRKASKQQTKKGKEVARPEPEPEPELAPPRAVQPPPQPEPEVEATPDAQLEQEAQEFHDASEVIDSSSATITKTDAAQPPKRGRGRPKKSSGASSLIVAEEVVPGPSSTRPELAPAAELHEQRAPSRVVEKDAEDFTIHEANDDENVAPAAKTNNNNMPPPPSPKLSRQQQKRPLPNPPTTASANRPLPAPPATPRAGGRSSPVPSSAKQPVLSPSPSPQSSDAENRPPSARPAASARANRVVLAPPASIQRGQPVATATTPKRHGSGGVDPAGMSPSKRTIGGLRSTAPWKAVDLELVFDDGLLEDDGDENGGGGGSPDKENRRRTADLLRGLTAEERKMSLEEWYEHVAEQAERDMKQRCEAKVSAFERAGARAMQALEGIVVEQ